MFLGGGVCIITAIHQHLYLPHTTKYQNMYHLALYTILTYQAKSSFSIIKKHSVYRAGTGPQI